MQELKIRRKIAKVYEPLRRPMRYKGAEGGRGSGKSHFFAEELLETAVRYAEQSAGSDVQARGLFAVSIREVQRTLKESAMRLLDNKLEDMGIGQVFKVQEDGIKTPCGGQIIFRGMQQYNATSIKSLEGYNIAWIEEAQDFSAHSLQLLRPTIREAGSEIWASWNPTRKTDAVDDFFKVKKPKNSVYVTANWRDNPWFNDTLEEERQEDLRTSPDQYPHIWEGQYATAIAGAYYAAGLAQAELDNRITKLHRDPVAATFAYWDIGGAGAKADAMAIWIVQKVDREINFLDYVEGQGQTLGYYTDWLRRNNYEGAHCVLPHDGVNTSVHTGKQFADHLRDAGFDVRVVPNQGPGAAMMRVQAARRLFPRMVFDREKTEHGRLALGWYHARIDQARNVDLGPEHDWSSNGADAFGLVAIDYEPPTTTEGKGRPPAARAGGQSWMGR